MLSSLATIQSLANKCGSQLPSNAIHLSVSGTQGTNYIVSTNGSYTYYAFATNCTLSIASIKGSGVPMYWCCVGGGGGGGNGNSTLSGSCNGANGGGMVYGIFNAISTNSFSIVIGSGGQGSISTVNGYTNNPPSLGINTTVSGTGLAITAYGGNSGSYNTTGGGGLAQITNSGGNSGTYSGLTSASVLNGGTGGLSEGSTGSNPTAGSTGNYCPLTPFQSGPYHIPLGSGGGGGANSFPCPAAAPFAGGAGNGTGYNGTINSTYNTAVLAVSGAVAASNAYQASFKNYSGNSASNSGAGGSSSQAQGNAGNGASGIIIVAIPTNNLY